MAERTVVGVDFSGAGEDTDVGKTWVTKGRFDGEVLTIYDCDDISRADLEKLLSKLSYGEVAAMDFPFSVPLGFAEIWQSSAVEMPRLMPHLWKAAAEGKFETFQQYVKSLPAGKSSQLLRIGDLAQSNALPCLHLGRPIMINMTFRGMQMLHRLWETGRFNVPPLDSSELDSHLPVLLEVMPGAALNAFGLPSTGYKDGRGSVERQKRQEKRKEILEKLTPDPGIQLPDSCIRLEIREQIRGKCIENQGGDALDSLVAAIVAAKWANPKSDFLVPTSAVVDTLKRKKSHKRQASEQAMGRTKIDVAQLEGWIYTPKPKQ